MTRNDPQVNLRFPLPLKQRLEAAAQTNKRSLTAEMVDRLEQSFVQPTEANDLARQIAEYLRNEGIK